MLNRLKPKSEFSRNVLTLMTGTTIAQAIPIAISPILTRIYTPEDFGVFALYMSVASILSVIATARYEVAIMLPEKDDDALNIMILSIAIACLISLSTLIVIILFNKQITTLLGNVAISNWLYLVPISILFTGLYQTFNYWENRQKKYKNLALSRVYQSSTTSAANLTIAPIINGSSGLILGNIFGSIVATLYLIKKSALLDKNFFQVIHINKILSVAHRYIKFPKFDLLASLLNVSAQQVVNILFNSIYSSIFAGYYYLTQKMLGLPVSMIAASVLDVFKEKASKDFQRLGNAKSIYVTTFFKLLALSLVPSIVIYVYAIDIFTFVFGEQWSESGVYARLLVPMLFLRFISSPLSFMLFIGDRQELNLFGNFLFLIGTLFSFYVASTPYDVIVNLSFAYSFVYLMYLWFSAKIAKVF